jgi:hypothetical protein
MTLWRLCLPLALATLTRVKSEYMERVNKLTNEQCKYTKYTTQTTLTQTYKIVTCTLSHVHKTLYILLSNFSDIRILFCIYEFLSAFPSYNVCQTPARI